VFDLGFVNSEGLDLCSRLPLVIEQACGGWGGRMSDAEQLLVHAAGKIFIPARRTPSWRPTNTQAGGCRAPRDLRDLAAMLCRSSALDTVPPGSSPTPLRAHSIEGLVLTSSTDYVMARVPIYSVSSGKEPADPHNAQSGRAGSSPRPCSRPPALAETPGLPASEAVLRKPCRLPQRIGQNHIAVLRSSQQTKDQLKSSTCDSWNLCC